jgi:hypothetical protein
MSKVFADKKPNLEELIHPQTEDQRARAKLLRDKYKMDPVFMKDVDAQFGPLEWRLPESHAIYWAALGLEKARQNPTRVNKDDLITLHRVVYQSMQVSFQRGRLISNPFDKRADFGPNLDIIPKVSAAYEQAAEEDKNYHDHILRAHRNFLRDAVYFLYENNRMKEANYWFKYIGQKYPNDRMLDGKPDSFPRNLTLDEYAVQRLQEDVGDMSKERTRAALTGMIRTSYYSLITDGEEERATGLMLLARNLWKSYDAKIQVRKEQLELPALDIIAKDVQDQLLNPKGPLPFEMRAMLRTRLRLPPEPTTPPTNPSAPTNTPPETAEKGAEGK